MTTATIFNKITIYSSIGTFPYFCNISSLSLLIREDIFVDADVSSDLVLLTALNTEVINVFELLNSLATFCMIEEASSFIFPSIAELASFIFPSSFELSDVIVVFMSAKPVFNTPEILLIEDSI